MPQADSPPPLHLTPAMWIAIGVLALLGIQRLTTNPTEPQRSVQDTHEVIRLRQNEHRFPQLGISLAPPKGWTYLAVQDDQNAAKVTFVNESDQSILQITPFQLDSWPPTERPLEPQSYEKVEIEWVAHDHRRVGRLRQGAVDVCLIVISPLRKSAVTDSIAVFCGAIRIME